MGTFDYERLTRTVKDFSYIIIEDIDALDKDAIINTLSYDGIIYEMRENDIVTGFDDSHRPTTKTINIANPILDLHKYTETYIKDYLKNLKAEDETIKFAYRTVQIDEGADSNKSIYKILKGNTNYLLPIARSFHKTYPDTIFNENIFKVTKLREDIFFITANVNQANKPRIRVIFAVNNDMFWKRFDVRAISADGLTMTEINRKDYNNSALDLINDVKLHNDQFFIKMRYINDEYTKLIDYCSRKEGVTNPKADNEFIDATNAVIEFTGLANYNKRTWLELFTQGTNSITYVDSTDIPNLESYKVKDSNTYYPGDDSEICMIYR